MPISGKSTDKRADWIRSAMSLFPLLLAVAAIALDQGKQSIKVNWLGQIRIGYKRRRLRVNMLSGGHYHDRQRGELWVVLLGMSKSCAIDHRHHQIEQNQLRGRIGVLEVIQCFSAMARARGMIALVLKKHGH